MNLFHTKNKSMQSDKSADWALLALNGIRDGVIITDRNGVIQYINPAAIALTNCGTAQNALGFDYGLVVRLESKEGRALTETENPMIIAMKTGQPLEKYVGSLIEQRTDKRVPVAISVLPIENIQGNRIITLRNIVKELQEEGEKTEFISTASHEMRTPVASIEGYLGLALNPQTATIDERARQYLTSAYASSQHLGKLFQDLLDTTKLDDGRIKPTFVPVELVGTVQKMTNLLIPQMQAKKLHYQFGAKDDTSFGMAKISQVVYGYVDVNFLQEIINNLVVNAIKYTPEGGSIYVNVFGDGDRALINVTDTGMGISADDLQHIFQKFYRADNSDTRTIGGTGLGLYLTKQRVEAMGGKIWAESAFGEGSTFYVSLPRITSEEYEKRLIIYQNQFNNPNGGTQ